MTIGAGIAVVGIWTATTYITTIIGPWAVIVALFAALTTSDIARESQ